MYVSILFLLRTSKAILYWKFTQYLCIHGWSSWKLWKNCWGICVKYMYACKLLARYFCGCRPHKKIIRTTISATFISIDWYSFIGNIKHDRHTFCIRLNSILFCDFFHLFKCTRTSNLQSQYWIIFELFIVEQIWKSFVSVCLCKNSSVQTNIQQLSVSNFSTFSVILCNVHLSGY